MRKKNFYFSNPASGHVIEKKRFKLYADALEHAKQLCMTNKSRVRVSTGEFSYGVILDPK